MPKRNEEDWLQKSKMSFGEHLEELRKAIFKSLAVLLVGTLVGLLFGSDTVDYIQTPLRKALKTFYGNQAEQMQVRRLEKMRAEGESVPADIQTSAKQMADDGLAPYDLYVDKHELQRALGLKDTGAKRPPEDASTAGATRKDLAHLRVYRPLEEDPRLSVIGLSAHEAFMVYVKASLVLGAMISSPFVFYFIWEFVAAGLYRHEKKYIYVFLPMSLGLFFAGAALAFFFVFDYVLNFLFWFNAQMNISPTPRISEWMSFVLMMPLGFGISFQMPLVMLFLERINVFTVQTYISNWRIAVLVISVLSMLLTPADPGSMLLMAIPLVVLYFGGIALCRYMPREGADTSDAA